MIVLITSNGPERKLRPVISSKQLDRGLQKRGLSGRALGNQSLDVILEGVERRTSATGRGGHTHIGSEPSREAIEDRKQGSEGRAFGHLRLEPPHVDADAMGFDLEIVALERERADDHFRCADEMPHLDHGGVAEGRRQREMQLFERALCDVFSESAPFVLPERRIVTRAGPAFSRTVKFEPANSTMVTVERSSPCRRAT